MKTENIIRLLAGTLVVAGVALAKWVDPAWIWLCAFVGLNLAQSAFTGFCPAEIVIRRLRSGSGKGEPGCCS